MTTAATVQLTLTSAITMRKCSPFIKAYIFMIMFSMLIYACAAFQIALDDFTLNHHYKVRALCDRGSPFLIRVMQWSPWKFLSTMKNKFWASQDCSTIQPWLSDFNRVVSFQYFWQPWPCDLALLLKADRAWTNMIAWLDHPSTQRDSTPFLCLRSVFQRFIPIFVCL